VTLFLAYEQTPGWVLCELAQCDLGRAGRVEGSLVTKGALFRAKRLSLAGSLVAGYSFHTAKKKKCPSKKVVSFYVQLTYLRFKEPKSFVSVFHLFLSFMKF